MGRLRSIGEAKNGFISQLHDQFFYFSKKKVTIYFSKRQATHLA